MANLTERIDALVALGNYLEQGDQSLLDAIELSHQHNPWFTPHQTERALRSLGSSMLNRYALQSWIAQYPVPQVIEQPVRIGLVMAGNIPLVGFHDFLCVLVSGHHALIKLSEKDRYLLPAMLDKLTEWYPAMQNHWTFVDQLTDLGAVIATGSNNSARYFQAYFGKYPHIIRRNRHSAGVLTGGESQEQLQMLCDDMLSYFGLGCRNVSKLYLPTGYDIQPLMEALERFPEIRDHHRFRNNFDYQYALLLLNQEPHLTNNLVLFRESTSLMSPMATVHFEYYTNDDQLQGFLERDREELQCVVSGRPLPGWDVVPFGQSQCPGLMDYADGVDVMAFLTELQADA